MGTFKIPDVRRKTRDVAPELTAKAPESLADPFRSDVPKLARAIGATGEAVTGLAVDLTQRIREHQAKKKEERIGNEYLETYTRGEQLYQEFKSKPEFDTDDPVTEFNDKIEELIGEAEVKLGGDKESIEELRKRLESDRKMWGKGLATKVVVDREVAAATYESKLLDKNAQAIQLDPTPDRLAFSIQQMEFTIKEQGGHEEGQEAKLIKLANQRLVESYLSSIGPEQALAELDSRKLGYGALFTDAKAKESFRRVLQSKVDSQRKRVEREKNEALDKLKSDVFDDLVKGVDVDPFDVYDNAVVKDDPKAQAHFKKLFDNYSKEVKQETRDREYRDIMTDPLLTTYTRDEILGMVQHVDDAKRVIDFQEDVLKNPSVNGRLYTEVLKSFKNDFNAEKFGTETEAEIEYQKQIRDFQEWALANPGEDPNEYYQKIMAPVNEDFFDRVFNLGPSEEDPVASREAIRFLRENNKPITTRNIQATVEYLKGREDE